MPFQAGLRSIQELGPELKRTISVDLSDDAVLDFDEPTHRVSLTRTVQNVLPDVIAVFHSVGSFFREKCSQSMKKDMLVLCVRRNALDERGRNLVF